MIPAVRATLIAAAVVLGVAVPAVAHPPDQHMPQLAETSTLMPVAPGLGFPSAAAGPSSAECVNGRAGPYPCENVDLESFVPLALLGGATGNDIWGWTDPQTGEEYAIVATSISTGFVNVTDPQNPVVVGILPTEEVGAFVLWRDVKVHKNHAFIVSEIDGHGMQVFDLTKLRGRTSPTVFAADTAFQEFGNAHNIAINEQSETAYVVGSDQCADDEEAGGLFMIDISSPKEPESRGCALVEDGDADTETESNNYVHDVQCVNYRASDPDPDYAGREICFGSNENAVVIYDVTDKTNPVVLSQKTYPTAAYTHQGWLTPDRKHFVFGDELDEGIASDPTLTPTVDNTTTYVTDVSDLDAPSAPRADTQETGSIDHNLFIKGSRVYQSNYTAGLRIQEFNGAAAASDDLLREIGFFDVVPAGDPNDFAGTWSNYPYFASGTVVVSTIENEASGLFVLRPRLDGETGRSSTGGQQDGASQGGSGGQDTAQRQGPRCFTAASRARKKRIGRAGLGNRRSNVRRTFGAEGSYRRFIDRYCLADGSTIRVGYPSFKQMRRLAGSERRRLRGKASLVLTSSRRSQLRGVNVGDGVRELRDRTGDRRGVRVGKNVWYVRRGSRAGHVFKVQDGVVREVGLADRKQTATNARVKRFFTSGR